MELNRIRSAPNPPQAYGFEPTIRRRNANGPRLRGRRVDYKFVSVVINVTATGIFIERKIFHIMPAKRVWPGYSKAFHRAWRIVK
jgi:hypothetical protein